MQVSVLGFRISAGGGSSIGDALLRSICTCGDVQ